MIIIVLIISLGCHSYSELVIHRLTIYPFSDIWRR